MPSLESLNVTSADLFDPAFVQENGRAAKPAADPASPSLERRWVDTCYPGSNFRPNFQAAIACAAYLSLLGSTPCTAPPGGIMMCSARGPGGNAQVWGIDQLSVPTTSSCHDVSRGVLWTAFNCRIDENTCWDGHAAAYGNGNLLTALHTYY